MKLGFMKIPTAGHEDLLMNEEKTMNPYRYTVHEDETFEEANCFNSDWDEEDARDIAVEAAGDYYSESGRCWGGNECISIEVFKEDGSSLGRFNVEYELVPQFWVSEEETAQRSCPC